MNEIWKDIDGYEGFYQVSSIGNVRSLDRRVENKASNTGFNLLKGRLMKLKTDKYGYIRIGLRNGSKQKMLLVHRLVAFAFLNREDYQDQVNHIDGIKGNNTIVNLEWCNQSENEKHAYRTGLKSQNGEKSNINKLTNEDVLSIRKRIASGEIQADLAREYNVYPNCISSIKLRRTWKHI